MAPEAGSDGLNLIKMEQTVVPAGPAGVPARPASSSRGWFIFWRVVRIAAWVFTLASFCLIVTVLTIGYTLYNRMSQIVPDVQYLMARNRAEPTRIYASDGVTLLAELRGEQRAWIPLEELKVTRDQHGVASQDLGNLPKATIAIEDWRFYHHPGMDPMRIVKAAWNNVRSGNARGQGGSTITEQLAVNVYLTRTKSFARRLNTALLALQLERRFSKDEILELYLNEIYYGNRSYGCEAAAQTYFNKHARDLTIAEAALLAGLPQSPARLDPFDHPDQAIKRQHVVLKAMLQHQKISYGQFQEAVQDEHLLKELDAARGHVTRRATAHWRAPYFVSYVKRYLEKTYDWSDDYLLKSGLKITTTLDPKLQAAAEKTVRDRLDDLGQSRLQAALVCIDPWSGHVLAMVGGRDYYDTAHNGEWNRAVQARRQPGSTFKPYIYATAMENGETPYSRVDDSTTLRVKGNEEVKSGGHEIKNYDFIHHGRLSYMKAIAISDNVAATRVLLKVGIANVIAKAHLMGIRSDLVGVPTLALGTSEVSPLEHISAFGVFCTKGLRAEDTPVERVENYAGEVLVEHAHPVAGARVLSLEASEAMWKMLRNVVTSGTGRNAAIDDVDVIGKTGTTSDNKDVWFLGGTKQLVCGVWMGYDRPRELNGSSGGRWCAPLWRSFMKQALDVWRTRQPVETMVEDARVTEQRKMAAGQVKKKLKICNESGLLATSACPNTHYEVFAPGDAPTRTCDIHRAADDTSLDDGSAGSLAPGDLGYSSPDSGTSPPLARHQTRATRSRRSNSQGPDAGDRAAAADSRPPDTAVPDEGDVARHGTDATIGGGESDEHSIGAEREVAVTVCADSGMLANPQCPVTMQQFFPVSQVPRRHCNLHGRH